MCVYVCVCCQAALVKTELKSTGLARYIITDQRKWDDPKKKHKKLQQHCVVFAPPQTLGFFKSGHDLLRAPEALAPKLKGSAAWFNGRSKPRCSFPNKQGSWGPP